MDAAAVCVTLGASLAGITWLALRGKVPIEPVDTSVYKRRVARVTKLVHYPLKSGRGVELEESYCGPRGLEHDRCWVVMGPHGEFMNQRITPSMVLIEPRLERHGNGDVTLHLTAPGMPELVAKQPSPNAPVKADVKVWAAAGEGCDLGEEAAAWVSRYLQTDGCRMYHMAARHRGRRLADGFVWENRVRKQDETSFADYAPLLMASEESLGLLNSKLATPLPMERFRPNITVAGCSGPHAEDSFEEVCVGESLVLRSVRPGSRCKITTVDPARGEFAGEEPLKTLRTYRLYEEVHDCEKHPWFGVSPLFGNNFIVVQPGTIRVGDTVRCR